MLDNFKDNKVDVHLRSPIKYAISRICDANNKYYLLTQAHK